MNLQVLATLVEGRDVSRLVGSGRLAEEGAVSLNRQHTILRARAIADHAIIDSDVLVKAIQGGLCAVQFEVIVELLVDGVGGSRLHLLDDAGNDRVLQQRNQDLGNLCHQAAVELDVNVVRVDLQVNLLGSELRRFGVGRSALLLGEVNEEVEADVIDRDVGRAICGDEAVLVLEVALRCQRQ